MRFFAFALMAILAGSAHAAAPAVDEIVRRSVANNERNWKAAPEYTFTETDVIANGGKRTTRTYEVLMIEGSQYNKLIAQNGKPLSREGAAAEQKKLDQEIARRRHESAGARQKRIAQYQRERHQDHALMREMTKAFDFKLAGQENVNGRDCYVLVATPRAGYRPTSRETKVLTGMRGKLWVDTQQYEWVRVHAEVFRPVAFGLFIAHVQPGTQFTLDEGPVGDGIWLPTHFATKVRANVLMFSRNSVDDETYTNYRRGTGQGRESARR